jgi:acyl dehydratase
MRAELGRRVNDASLTRTFVRALLPVRNRPAVLAVPARSLTNQPIDRTALAAYQRVCSFDVSDAVPPTYLHVLAFPLSAAIMARSDFPLPLVGLVHVANCMRQLRPVTADERLDLRVWADDLRPHRVGTQVDLVATAAVAGVPVWEGRSTYLHREAAAPNPRRSESTSPRDTEPAPAEWGAAALWRVPADIGRRYAAVSGDCNPIHLHPLTAKAFGFRRAIAHGMWLHARALAGLAPRLAEGYSAVARFKKPVLLPSRVAVRTVPQDDGYVVELASVLSGAPHMTLTVSWAAEQSAPPAS